MINNGIGINGIDSNTRYWTVTTDDSLFAIETAKLTDSSGNPLWERAFDNKQALWTKEQIISLCRTDDHRIHSLVDECLGRNTSASMQRALPPPMRSMVSMFTGNGVV